MCGGVAMSTHSASYSQSQQHRFVTGWFSDWSQFQREDFAPALAQKLKPSLYVNGLVGGLQRMGRPPSIFQCQVKLFQEWSDSWTDEERQRLREALVQEDSSFGALLEEALAAADDVNGGGSEPAAETAGQAEADADGHTEDASIDSQSSELTPTEI